MTIEEFADLIDEIRHNHPGCTVQLDEYNAEVVGIRFVDGRFMDADHKTGIAYIERFWGNG